MPLETVELLRKLTSAFGPSGFEEEARAVIRAIVEPLVDDVRVDTLGNLIATKRGRGSRTLMLDAHTDEIGFLISYVEDGGFLRFTTLGGWDARIVPSQAMTIRADDGSFIKGMIGTSPPHILQPEDRDKPFKLDDLFVDIGASSAEEVAELGIRTGSPAVISYPFEQLNDRVIMAKAIDDRGGCGVLIRVLEALTDETLDITVVANFAVQEEVGLRGAQTAAYQIDPDLAIAVEGSIAADVPGVPASRQPMRQGRGPALSVLDSTMIPSARMVNALTSIANDAGIPWQYKVPAPGGTDAGAIHRNRAGVLAGVVSIPCRYIHSPYAVMRLEDFENAARLVTEFARRGPGMLSAPTS